MLENEGPDRARIRLDGSDPHTGNRDFVLRYQLAGKQVATGLLLHEDKELGENFFLLTGLSPERMIRLFWIMWMVLVRKWQRYHTDLI